jgi:two-component system chemotaxis sensor kinase CheA
MLPIANIFNKFPRMVRDLARKTNKEVELLVSGQETELDRSLLEEINDPLIHLVRNAVDHGIETPDVREAAGKPREGTVRLSAHHEQGRIVLTVADDGKGINTDKLKASAVKRDASPKRSRGHNHEKAVT